MMPSHKYQRLYEHLHLHEADQITLTLEEIEQLIGSRLPMTARTQRAWWSNRRKGAVQATAWIQAGYRTAQIDLDQGQITFYKPGKVYHVQRQGDLVVWDANLVKALRYHMRLTQAEFARELGVRQPTVSEWETGVYGPRRSSSKLLTLVAARVRFRYE
ncbi:MAG: helix-turn-helix domain-containing protein [Caldilineaceae bacterium]|nr:helix-turn-helix domain-containing protein [Caldilineaceae bacterium]